jgi:shikimate kinase
MRDFFQFYSDLQEGVNDPAIFKAVFLAGGPGSGKSFIVGKTALTALGFRLINSDDAFERKLAAAGLEMNPENIYSAKGQEIRNSAKELTAKQMTLAVDGRLGLVIDGTGKNFEKIKKQASALRELGYEVSMIFVNTDLDTAVKRNRMRARSLPDAEVKSMWEGVQKNLGGFQSFFRQKFFIVDNSEGQNYEKETLSVYKKMMVWSKTKPESRMASDWIKSQRIRESALDEVAGPDQCWDGYKKDGT